MHTKESVDRTIRRHSLISATDLVKTVCPVCGQYWAVHPSKVTISKQNPYGPRCNCKSRPKLVLVEV